MARSGISDLGDLALGRWRAGSMAGEWVSRGGKIMRQRGFLVESKYVFVCVLQYWFYVYSLFWKCRIEVMMRMTVMVLNRSNFESLKFNDLFLYVTAFDFTHNYKLKTLYILEKGVSILIKWLS